MRWADAGAQNRRIPPMPSPQMHFPIQPIGLTCRLAVAAGKSGNRPRLRLRRTRFARVRRIRAAGTLRRCAKDARACPPFQRGPLCRPLVVKPDA
jgi:hypothetical protein